MNLTPFDFGSGRSPSRSIPEFDDTDEDCPERLRTSTKYPIGSKQFTLDFWQATLCARWRLERWKKFLLILS
jgi:hypothetical protein